MIISKTILHSRHWHYSGTHNCKCTYNIETCLLVLHHIDNKKKRIICDLIKDASGYEMSLWGSRSWEECRWYHTQETIQKTGFKGCYLQVLYHECEIFLYFSITQIKILMTQKAPKQHFRLATTTPLFWSNLFFNFPIILLCFFQVIQQAYDVLSDPQEKI